MKEYHPKSASWSASVGEHPLLTEAPAPHGKMQTMATEQLESEHAAVVHYWSAGMLVNEQLGMTEVVTLTVRTTSYCAGVLLANAQPFLGMVRDLGCGF